MSGTPYALCEFADLRRRVGDALAEIRDLADQTPEALNELGGPLDTLFGPDDIAIRREIGQHEPARRISAVSAYDVVGIDRVPLGFRHLFDEADVHGPNRR